MWNDKVVLITGSRRGIGRHLANEIGKQGGKVVLNARNKNRLEETATQLKAQGLDVAFFPGDISDHEICTKIIGQTIAAYGKLDVLINNAGISAQGSVEELHPDVFRQIMDVNFMGAVYMTQAALPHIKQTGGSILFIGSLAGIHGIGNHAAYCCSKMALTALVESMRIELHQAPVHIGLAYVGFTENDPEKTLLDKNGRAIPQLARNGIKQMPAQQVARQLMRMVERRQPQATFTMLGKLNAFINRISPTVVHRILLNAYSKSSY